MSNFILAELPAKPGMIGVEHFHEKFDRDTPPFSSEEVACRFSSQMEVGFEILLKWPKITS